MQTFFGGTNVPQFSWERPSFEAECPVSLVNQNTGSPESQSTWGDSAAQKPEPQA